MWSVVILFHGNKSKINPAGDDFVLSIISLRVARAGENLYMQEANGGVLIYLIILFLVLAR